VSGVRVVRASDVMVNLEAASGVILYQINTARNIMILITLSTLLMTAGNISYQQNQRTYIIDFVIH